MAELSLQERLQPSLLDRLTDNDPEQRQEAATRRVLTVFKLRDCVLRDLTWLLNTSNLGIPNLAEDHPEVARSVLNFGLPDMCGLTNSSVDTGELAQLVRQAIWDFEPRILRSSLRVRAISADDGATHNCLRFEIEGELWAQPIPLELLFKTELDLETGNVIVSEQRD